MTNQTVKTELEARDGVENVRALIKKKKKRLINSTLIENLQSMMENQVEKDEYSLLVALNDNVLLRFDKEIETGRVAFIGPVDGKKETQYGIILDSNKYGDTNGTFNHISYFKTKNTRGIFVGLQDIVTSHRM